MPLSCASASATAFIHRRARGQRARLVETRRPDARRLLQGRSQGVGGQPRQGGARREDPFFPAGAILSVLEGEAGQQPKAVKAMAKARKIGDSVVNSQFGRRDRVGQSEPSVRGVDGVDCVGNESRLLFAIGVAIPAPGTVDPLTEPGSGYAEALESAVSLAARFFIASLHFGNADLNSSTADRQ